MGSGFILKTGNPMNRLKELSRLAVDLLEAAIIFAVVMGLALGLGAASAPAADLSGYGLMQGGNRNNALSDAQFRHPKISFLVLRDRWNKQEPQPGVYNFTYNAAQIRRCRRVGKPYICAPMTGVSGIPAHVARVPWDAKIPAAWAKFIYAQANTEVDGVKVKDDPLLAAVWLGCLGEPSQEGHLNGLERTAGYSPAAMLSVITQCGDATIAAFPRADVKFIYSVSGQPAVQKYQPQALAHFKAKLGKDRLRVQHNSLGPQTTVTATHHKILLDLQREGYKVGAEMVQPGRTAGLSKFPQASYFVLYPGDERALR